MIGINQPANNAWLLTTVWRLYSSPWFGAFCSATSFTAEQRKAAKDSNNRMWLPFNSTSSEQERRQSCSTGGGGSVAKPTSSTDRLVLFYLFFWALSQCRKIHAPEVLGRNPEKIKIWARPTSLQSLTLALVLSGTVVILKKNGHLPTAFTAFTSQQISGFPRWDQDQAPRLPVGPPPHSLHLLPRQLPAEAEHTSGDPRRLHGEQQSVVAAVSFLLITPHKHFQPELHEL